MADSLPPEIRRRLGLLLAMLTSSHDGEVLNAARLSVKLLAQHGWRPEALATQSGGGGISAAELDAAKAEALFWRTQAEAASRKARGPFGATATSDEDDIVDAAAFAAWLLDEAPNLSDRETNFLTDLVDKEWRRPTEKQSGWLRSIARKVPPTARKYGT